MPAPNPLSPSWMPRFVAPHFTEVEGSADLPGEVWRACAFTTAMAGAAANATGATHRHHCLLRGPGAAEHKASRIHWRTESQEVAGGSTRVEEGVSAGLADAVEAALGAAQAPGMTPALCVAPAFVEVRREPGLPRVWVSGHLCEAGGRTYLQTAFIRAWPAGGISAFRGTLEILPCTPEPSGAVPFPRHLRWSAASLEEALRLGMAYALGPRMVAWQRLL